jgi:DNA-binding transcriptional ArsR family regulator
MSSSILVPYRYHISPKKFSKKIRLKFCATKRFPIFVQPKGFIFMRRDVFQAIADPTRREILNMLAHQSLNVNSVAENFDVSRTAVYKHVKILAECGLVVMKQQGRERFCEAKLERLNEVSDWVAQYKRFWEAKLDYLEMYLNELQSKPEIKAKKKRS